MIGTNELSQLALVLQNSADLSRELAMLCPDMRLELEALADRTASIASEFQELVRTRLRP